MSEELNQLKKTLEETKKSVATLQKQVLSIKKRLLFATVYGIAKLVLIFVPLILGLWYFAPQIGNMYEAWQALTEDISSLQRGEYISADDQIQDIIGEYFNNQE